MSHIKWRNPYRQSWDISSNQLLISLPAFPIQHLVHCTGCSCRVWKRLCKHTSANSRGCALTSKAALKNMLNGQWPYELKGNLCTFPQVDATDCMYCIIFIGARLTDIARTYPFNNNMYCHCQKHANHGAPLMCSHCQQKRSCKV